MNEVWPGVVGPLKINTALLYDENYEKVTAWGIKALATEPSKKDKKSKTKPVELFKFHLGNVPEDKKPKLPEGVTPEKLIADYLREMGNYTVYNLLKR